MEILPYTIGVVLFTLAIYWSAANTAAKPGTPVFGLFRYREAPGDKANAPGNPSDGRRRFQPDAVRPGVARPDAARGTPNRRLQRR